MNNKLFDQRPDSCRGVSLHILLFALPTRKFLGEKCGVAVSAQIKLGGEEGREFSIEAADVILIPAGVGHCRLGSTNDFRVAGACEGGEAMICAWCSG